MRNDFAGAQVFPPPVVMSEKAVTSHDTECPLGEARELLPECAETQVVSQQATRENLSEKEQVALPGEAASVAPEESYVGRLLGEAMEADPGVAGEPTVYPELGRAVTQSMIQLPSRRKNLKEAAQVALPGEAETVTLAE